MSIDLKRLHDSGELDLGTIDDQLYDTNFGNERLRRAPRKDKKNPSVDVAPLLDQLASLDGVKVQIPTNVGDDENLRRALEYFISKFGTVTLPSEARPFAKDLASPQCYIDELPIIQRLMQLPEKNRSRIAQLLCLKVLESPV